MSSDLGFQVLEMQVGSLMSTMNTASSTWVERSAVDPENTLIDVGTAAGLQLAT
jgi:hypothetical protein